MNVPDLMLGKTYWVLTDLEHGIVLGEREFKALKRCVLYHYLTVAHDNLRYCFREVDEEFGEHHELHDWESEQWVFNTVDEYLHYLVVHVDGLNNREDECKLLHTFDDFLKQKITESQEKHPEIWI